MSEKIFAVTGAGGFVGSAVVAGLRARGMAVRALVRGPGAAGTTAVGEIGAKTDWSRALDGVTHVIHAAARAHVMRDRATDPLVAYREVNVAGTRRLAEQAVRAGVHRLVLVSSVKVNGERTAPGSPFTTSHPPAPEDAYGRSKWEAEKALLEATHGTELETVVVRPPLVYGPGMKGNLARLLRWVRLGVPLPFGAVANRRSLIALDNLVDVLVCCATHPRAAGETFLVSDGEDLSTAELVRRMGRAVGRPARLLPVPPACLRVVGALIGRGAEIQRLTGSLQVDIGPTCAKLGWRPVIGIDQGLVNSVGLRLDHAK